MDQLSERDQEVIQRAIEQAELDTSGEIRVFIDEHCQGDPFEAAVTHFEELGMGATKLRNGVLVYVATIDHRFAIIGDKGINEKVPADFWESTKEIMRSYFSQGKLAEGIAQGVLRAGEQLKQFFPYQDADMNELPNEILFRKKNV